MYDLEGNFPNLPRRHNQNQQVQQPLSTNSQQEPSQSIPSVLTQDIMNKFHEDLKKTFTEMIKIEVKNQIQQERAAM
jgi:hypothetical protein